MRLIASQGGRWQCSSSRTVKRQRCHEVMRYELVESKVCVEVSAAVPEHWCYVFNFWTTCIPACTSKVSIHHLRIPAVVSADKQRTTGSGGDHKLALQSVTPVSLRQLNHGHQLTDNIKCTTNSIFCQVEGLCAKLMPEQAPNSRVCCCCYCRSNNFDLLQLSIYQGV